MSSGFVFLGKDYWGTNGAIESYMETMSKEAETRFGKNDPLTTFLYNEWECFFSGKVISLNEILNNTKSRKHFIQLLEFATEKLASSFTEYGRDWIKTVIQGMREQIVKIDC